MKKVSIPFEQISDSSPVKLTECGSIFEVMSQIHKSKGNDVRKLSSDTYYRLRDRVSFGSIDDFYSCGFSVSSDGEVANSKTHVIKKGFVYPVRFYKRTSNRFQSPNELRRTFKKIRNIINCNTADLSRCKFCTLTYKENMTDTKKLCEDFRRFNQRFKRYVNKNFGMKYEYIAIAEPQARGAWHMHIIYIFDGKAPYIHYSEYSRIWGLGYVDLKAMPDNDNIGAYFSAYLSNLVVDDGFETSFNLARKDVTVKNNKKFIKGGRLSMYPAKFNILRTSRGIKRPVIDEMDYAGAKKVISSHISPKLHKTVEECCTYRNCVLINVDIGDNGDKSYTNTIWYEYYNVSRKGRNSPHKVIKKSVEDSAQLTLEDYEEKCKRDLLKSSVWQSLFDEACSELDYAESAGYRGVKDEVFKKYSFISLDFWKNARKVINEYIEKDINSGKFVSLS